MANYFPCPNTQCNYQFDADILPAAAMVTCPLCRTRFPYRASRPAPTAEYSAETGTNAPPAPTSRVVNLRNQPKGTNPIITVLVILGLGLFLAGVVYFLRYKTQNPVRVESSEVAQERLNFKLEKFPEGWEEDMKTREAMSMNVFVRKRTNPDGWIAMYAEDFKDRNPRAGELKDKMLSRLKSYGRNMFFQDLVDAKWMGQPGQAYKFQGDFNDVSVSGECIAVSYKGIGYIFYMWAPDRDWAAVKDDLLAQRGKISLMGYREKWSEQKANTKLYIHENPNYVIEDIDAIWQMGAPAEEGVPTKKTDYIVDPKEIDPTASFAFRAKFQIKAGGDTRQLAAEAKAIVVELKQGGDPLETVKNHLIERIKKDYAGDVPDIKLEPLAKSPSGIDLPNDGPAMARYLFRDPLDRDNRHMYVISAITVDGMTIGVETDVLERNANYVEEWMVHLAASLKKK